MEDFLLLYNKIMTGEELGLKRPGGEVVIQSPHDPSIVFCATVCPVLALMEDHKDLLPAKPLPCCVHSSLPFPPARAQRALLPLAVVAFRHWHCLGVFAQLKKLLKVSLWTVFLLVYGIPTGCREEKKVARKLLMDNRQWTWITSLHCTASANTKLSFALFWNISFFFPPNRLR